MFTAYFDASGSDDQAVLCVAGFVGLADQWIAWERQWLERLQKDDLSYFHSKKLALWEKDKRSKLIADLSKIIQDHLVFKTAVVAVRRMVQTVFSNEQRKKWHINPYSLAGWAAAREMRVWAYRWGGGLPELVFERGDAGADYLRKLMPAVGYPEPIFKPKKRYVNPKTGIVEEPLVPFQAADLLAYAVFSRVRVYERDGFIRSEFKRLPAVLEKIPGQCGTIELDRLKLLKQSLEQDDPLILIPWVKINTKDL